MHIEELTEQVQKFREGRNWKLWGRHQKPKDFALALIAEAAELAEHFKWHTDAEMKRYIKGHKTEIGEELCDILFWVLLMSKDFEINIAAAFEKKMKKNEEKYPAKIY